MMNRKTVLLVILLTYILLIGPVCADQKKIPVIIVFKEDQTGDIVQSQNIRSNFVHQNGGIIKHQYRIINGVSAMMTENDIELLSKNKNILYIEQDIEVHALEQSIPWGVEKVNAPAVHPINKGSGIKIAVIDSGIDYTHPDLDDNYKGGYDFVNNDNDPMDDYGHGTGVASIIAAEDNSFGIVGVAPESSLYSLKVIGSDGRGSVSNVIKAIEWAVDNDMDIISMSIGSTRGSQTFENAVENAYNSGLLLVASAGNSGSKTADTVLYPANFDAVIAVSAIDRNDNLAGFSSVGPAVEFAAPGVSVETTMLGGGYGRFWGTSAAAPFVTGVAALVMASDPTMTNVEIRQQLQTNAIDLGESGRDTKFGFGIPIANVETPRLKVNIVKDLNPISSGQNTQITAHVTSGNSPVAGTIVSISASGGNLEPVTGTTDAHGDFTTTYTAPEITTQTQFTISATATKTGYNAGSDSTTITVDPLPEPQLMVTLIKGSEILEPGDTTHITAHVTSGNSPVAGTTVSISASGGNLEPVTGTTDAHGDFTTIYTAPEITTQTQFTISATATKTGYNAGSDSTTITVDPLPEPQLMVTLIKGSEILEPGDTTHITAHVTSDNSPVAGVAVLISASGGNLDPVAGTTNANGDFTTVYTAPDILIQTQFTISATVTKTGYNAGTDSSTITVDPLPEPQLLVTLFKGSEILVPGGITQITAHVTSDNSPVAGATVSISASGGNLEPVTGTTNANGDFTAVYTAPDLNIQTQFTILATVTKTGYNEGTCSDVIAINPVTTNLPESPHPYTKSYDNTWTISEPGATKMKIHFSRLETEKYFDHVYIYDKNNVEIARYDGNHDGFWTQWIDGDIIKIRLKSDGSIQKFGFIVDKVDAQSTSPILKTTIIKTHDIVKSNQSIQLTVHVANGNTPVANAAVTVSTSGGFLDPIAGTTDANGDFITTYTAPNVETQAQFTISATASKTGFNKGSYSDVITINPESTNHIESPHPYPKSYDNTWTISEPGAGRIRIHFSRLETEIYFDRVYIYDKNNVEIARYDGNNNGIWTQWIDGDIVKVKLTSDGSIQKFGIIIDQIETKS